MNGNLIPCDLRSVDENRIQKARRIAAQPFLGSSPLTYLRPIITACADGRWFTLQHLPQTFLVLFELVFATFQRTDDAFGLAPLNPHLLADCLGNSLRPKLTIVAFKNLRSES